MKRVAIQVTIASNLPWPVTLTALTLAPQHGFRLDPSMGHVKSLCPLTLHPSSTASALLFVSTKSGGRSASRGNMLHGGAGQGRQLHVGSVTHSVLFSVTPACFSIPLLFVHLLIQLLSHLFIHPFIHACIQFLCSLARLV